MKPAILGCAAALACAVALLSACGYVGNPLPPALEIPQRVTDLAAVEYGDKVRVEFTVPAMTTEGLLLKTVRSVELRIGPPPNPWNENAWAASAKVFDVPAAVPGHVSFDAPAAEWIGREVVIAARATGPKGKTSEWSNLRTLPIQPPLAGPADVQAKNVPHAVELSWTGSAPRYRIFRASGDTQPELIGESDQPQYRDSEIEYGKPYRYYVQASAGELQQSKVAGPQAIVPEDVFPPSVPSGLTAEVGTNSIELSWERNTDAGFGGYNVYRSVDGANFEKIAAGIPAPAYSDRAVEAGKKYRYEISAVGTNGRESARSSAAEVAAQ